MITTKRTTYRTHMGGVRQVWTAFDLGRAMFGIGRSRRAALADVKPDEQRELEGSTHTPSDYDTVYIPPSRQSERKRRVPAWA